MSRLGGLAAALWMLAALVGAAHAQTPAPAPGTQPASVADLSASVDRAESQLQAIRAALRAPDVTDDALKTQIAAVPPIQADLARTLADLSQRLQNVNQRLAQIGPAPTPHQTEAPETSGSRRTLTRAQQTLDAEVKQAKLTTVEAQQLIAALAARRQQMFSQQLGTPSRSILSPRLWIDFVAATPKDLANLRDVFADEAAQFAAAARRLDAVALWIAGALAAILLLGPAPIFLNRFGFSQISRFGPDTRLRRSGLALWSSIVSGVAPLLAGLILRGALLDSRALTAPFDQFAELCIRILVFVFLFAAIGRAILAPGRPSWRLAPIADEVVARLAPYPAVVALAAALSSMATGAAGAFGASPPTYVAADCVTLLLELAAVAVALLMLGWARHGGLDLDLDATEAKAGGRLPWMLTALAAWLGLACAILAVLFGYLALASFLARQMIWTAMVLGALFIAAAFVDDLFPAVLSPEGSVGRFIRVAIGLSSAALEPIAVLLSGLSRLALFVLAWIAVIEPFGGAAGNLYGSLASGPLVLKLGQVSISPTLVLGALAVFLVGLGVTRAIRAWFDRRYLPTTRMDLGARTSLSLGVSYLGGLVALIAACAYLGVSLDKITLVASALSVGIGFGLQAIISNFISGLILLAERPIKVGDWIAIGDQEGDVRRVNVRATEIEMFDRSKLIIPNSDLISKPVRNITHAGSLGRVAMTFLIDGAADPERVRALILERLAGHAEILAEPSAKVFLMSVKDGALEFLTLAYVDTPRDVLRVRSELLYQLIPAFKAAGMKFASSTPTVTINAPVGAGAAAPQAPPSA